MHDRTAIQSNKQVTTTSKTSLDSCPECDGQLDLTGHEVACDECGLVVEADKIDHGPDWRDFDNQSEKRAATVDRHRRHDKGLGSQINYSSKAEEPMSSAQRRQFARLRTWHKRARVGSKAERNQIQGFTEIKRIATSSGLPKHVESQACQLFKTAQKEGLLRGRTIEGFSGASLYAAARINEVPRGIDAIVELSKVPKDRVQNAYSTLNQELNLPVPPAVPRDYLGQFISDSELGPPERQRAATLLEAVAETGICQGRNPRGVAAGAMYLAACVENGGTMYCTGATQEDIATIAGVSAPTVRATRDAIVNELGEQIPWI